MPGFTHNDNSIANGVPARHISPESGSFGDATMTNKSGTSEGANEAADSTPAGAAGLEAPITTGKTRKEARNFAPDPRPTDPILLETDEESPAQQIADGDDRIRHEHDRDD